MPDRRRIALIFGGRNSEHEVSCRSAAAIMTHLDRDRYEVTPVRIDTTGVWTVGADARPAGEADAVTADDLIAMTRPAGALASTTLPAQTPDVSSQSARMLDVPSQSAGTPGLSAQSAQTSALPSQSAGRLDLSSRPVSSAAHRATSIADALAIIRTLDLALPALHGPFGEDGTLQALLAGAGVRYAGNGVLASAASMDKEHTKSLLAADGLRVADAVVLRGGESEVSAADRARLGLPVFVKPARGGSSLGVSKVDRWDDIEPALATARETTGEAKVLIEAAVAGREVDVAVLEHPDGRVVAGPALEIRVTGAQTFFDYAAKYSGAGSAFDIPARLAPEVADAVADQAIRAFRALGCGGLLRVDFFLPHDGSAPVINEVNTLPGLTPASQFPQIWSVAGIAYPQLLEILIETALARYPAADPVLI